MCRASRATVASESPPSSYKYGRCLFRRAKRLKRQVSCMRPTKHNLRSNNVFFPPPCHGHAVVAAGGDGFPGPAPFSLALLRVRRQQLPNPRPHVVLHRRALRHHPLNHLRLPLRALGLPLPLPPDSVHPRSPAHGPASSPAAAASWARSLRHRQHPDHPPPLPRNRRREHRSSGVLHLSRDFPGWG